MSGGGLKTNNGVYSWQALKGCVELGVISSNGAPVGEDQIQPASMDLRLGPKAYRLVSSFLPEGHKVVEKLHDPDVYGSDLVMYETDISGGGILEKGHVYLIPLMEELRLPEGVAARANPKSTTGRLDIFARVLTDYNPRFDDIAGGYSGRLFLEVLPRSFTIKVKEGLSLVQLRLMDGECTLSDEELKDLHIQPGILYEGDKEVTFDSVKISKGLFMGVDLVGDGSSGVIGYKSRKNSHVVDLTKINHYNIKDFWDPIYRNEKGTLILEPEDFYILSSKEKIRIPPEYAAEMAAYEAGSGELRTHYAGFFDPGFGYGLEGEVKGTKAVLEVRAHDVPFMIAHGQTFCKLTYEKMQEVPEKVYGPKIGSSYQFQGITLSKQFINP
ncbi:MAG: 2'-deoxycytidine 5'-triphosphate deaminase [Thermodesulfobacteriota bacterium]|nr:MAG: 2'-deoxycytidine 5'-triphosphate deaminase [Thermodesulfobacteriota bacterium]